jgi:hypothetical protein
VKRVVSVEIVEMGSSTGLEGSPKRGCRARDPRCT